MTYNVEQLEAVFRREVEDNEEPLFWDSEEFYRLLTDAELEFAKRAKILSDHVTYDVVATEPEITIDDWVVDTRRAWLTSRPNRKLTQMNVNEMDQDIYEDIYGWELTPDWLTETGEPRRFIMDFKKDTIRLSPIPEVDDTLEMLVWRTPRKAITGTGSKLEITKREHQLALVWGVCSMALGQQDSDTFDPDRAKMYLRRFENAIADAEGEQRRLRRRPGTVQYGGL